MKKSKLRYQPLDDCCNEQEWFPSNSNQRDKSLGGNRSGLEMGRCFARVVRTNRNHTQVENESYAKRDNCSVNKATFTNQLFIPSLLQQRFAHLSNFEK